MDWRACSKSWERREDRLMEMEMSGSWRCEKAWEVQRPEDCVGGGRGWRSIPWKGKLLCSK